MPMLPWPIWPLAWQARLGQNTVVGSTAVLLILAVKWIHRSMLGSPFASQWRPTTVRCGATAPPHAGANAASVEHGEELLPQDEQSGRSLQAGDAARGSDRTSAARGSDRTPTARGSDRAPTARGSDGTSAARGSDRTSAARGSDRTSAAH